LKSRPFHQVRAGSFFIQNGARGCKLNTRS
jgi:hypothetical protein